MTDISKALADPVVAVVAVAAAPIILAAAGKALAGLWRRTRARAARWRKRCVARKAAAARVAAERVKPLIPTLAEQERQLTSPHGVLVYRENDPIAAHKDVEFLLAQTNTLRRRAEEYPDPETTTCPRCGYQP